MKNKLNGLLLVAGGIVLLFLFYLIGQIVTTLAVSVLTFIVVGKWLIKNDNDTKNILITVAISIIVAYIIWNIYWIFFMINLLIILLGIWFAYQNKEI